MSEKPKVGKVSPSVREIRKSPPSSSVSQGKNLCACAVPARETILRKTKDIIEHKSSSSLCRAKFFAEIAEKSSRRALSRNVNFRFCPPDFPVIRFSLHSSVSLHRLEQLRRAPENNSRFANPSKRRVLCIANETKPAAIKPPWTLR